MNTKKKTWLVCGILALIAAGMIGWRLLSSASGSGAGVYATRVSDLTGSGMIFVQRYAGVVENENMTKIEKDSSRKIAEVKVAEGDAVEPQTVLFVYDVRDAENGIAGCNLDIEEANAAIAKYNSDIAQLENEMVGTGGDVRLSYTERIQQIQNDITSTQYSIRASESEIASYQKDINTAEVKAGVRGTVKSINESGYDTNGNELPYMEIQQSEDFRVKGKMDEQSIGTLVQGQEVIVRSRIDESAIWHGMVTKIDTEPITESSGYYSSSDDASSKYPFYIQLEDSDGLMLGQHVFIEPDYGQGEISDTLELDASFFFQDDDGNWYVWALDHNNRLEKREVELGELNEETYSYPVLNGLSEEDYIAYPDASYSEGMKCVPYSMGEEMTE